jgi:hypothetical protein
MPKAPCAALHWMDGGEYRIPNYYFDSKAAIGVAVYAETRAAINSVITSVFPKGF